MKSRHQQLIDAMKALEYPCNDTGICLGFASAGLQAILSRDTDSFDRRIQLIESLSPAELAKKVNAAHQRWKDIVGQIKSAILYRFFTYIGRNDLQQKIDEAMQKLDDETKVLLTMHAFFSELELYQNIGEYPHLFPDKKTKNQNIKLASSLIQPDILISQHGFDVVNQFCGAYSVQDLYFLLTSFREKLTARNVQFPVCMMLSSINHVLTIGFDSSSDKWMFIEAHNGATNYFEDVKAISYIHTWLTHNDVAVINTRIFAAGNYLNQIGSIVAEWMREPIFLNYHEITSERVKSSDSNNVSLLHVLALANIDDVENIVNHRDTDVNQATISGLTPFVLSCAGGNINCLRALLQHPEFDIQKAREMIDQAVTHAAINGDPACLAEIFKHPELGADSIEIVRSGLMIAISCGHAECVRIFIAQFGNITDSVKTIGDDAIFFAIQKGYAACLAELLNVPEFDVNLKRNHYMSPIVVAVENGEKDCVRELLKRTDLDMSDEITFNCICEADADILEMILQALLDNTYQKDIPAPLYQYEITRASNYRSKEVAQMLTHYSERILAKHSVCHGNTDPVQQAKPPCYK